MDDGDGHDDDDSDGGHGDDDSVGGDGGHDGDDSDGGDAGDGCDGGDGDIDGDDANEYTSGECLQQKEVETRNDTFSLFIYGIQFFLLCFRMFSVNSSLMLYLFVSISACFVSISCSRCTCNGRRNGLFSLFTVISYG